MKRFLAAAVISVFSLGAFGNDVGSVKVARGAVAVERDGKRLNATIGMAIRPADTIITGADGSVGITFTDNSLLSAGPNSVLAIDKYQFDSTTYAGEFDASLKSGTLAAVSGKMVKQNPESMRVHTPAAIMGVRGTEFLVKVDQRP
jgi:hypothetical protein